MYTHRQTEKAVEKHFLISASEKKGVEEKDEEKGMGTTCLHAVVDGRFQYGGILMA